MGHSPGPWMRDQDGDVRDRRGDLVAMIYPQADEETERLNGHLVKAAPALLSALEFAYAHMDPTPGREAEWHKHMAAITFAKGGA